MRWPWQKAKPLPIPPYVPPVVEIKQPPPPAIEVDYSDPGWSLKTMSTKIRQYWGIESVKKDSDSER